MPAPFIHLHTHSHYSLLDGLSKIPDLVARAARYKMPALALTDHGNLYGAIEFYKECKQHDINPIIGVEAYVAARSRTDKEPRIDNHRFHLTLLAKNIAGYKNLLLLVTKANLEGLYYKPRVDKELLATHRDGLITLSGCMAGELARTLTNRGVEDAERVAREYRDIFGPENYFIEIMHHPGVAGQQKLTQELVSLAHKLEIPLVLTQDSHYLDRDDKRAHQTLLAVQTQNDVGESDLFRGEEDFSFISTEDAYRAFAALPEAVENTSRIAERCAIELELGKLSFPSFTPEGNMAPYAALRAMTIKGLHERNLDLNREALERIEYELNIIDTKGYTSYILVVADLLRFAHQNGILTTTRGSAAGSMVGFLTGITNVDPIALQLPFERFLNPQRPSPPDIDMDFADNRRDEVIDYARKKYGETQVAQIGTFGTMLARGVVRDVARALGKPYALGDKIARAVPMGSQGFPMTIDRAFEMEPDLKKMYTDDAEAREVIDLGKKLEGCVRHVSVHAAGVVISPTPLTDYVPLQRDPKGGKIITQYDMYAVEDAGLPKFDFLGIRNLSILADSVDQTKKMNGAAIDIENLPLDDAKTYRMLARGETVGLFQLSGEAMTHYLIDLKPSTIHDINAMVALYRPGPMANIPEYIARKRGKKPVTYYHPKMQTFLERSLGILVYQEDLLFTAIELAGYNWESVDRFRKAVGKKIPEEMAKQHVIFVEGCMKHSEMTRESAEGLWKLFEPFQGYGFNRAHAASYGKVAYQTAYMKANFPVEYMSAVLTAESGDVEKVAEIIAECKRMGIAVLPPDVNESFGGFTIVDPSLERGKIRFGLYTIKNFGEGIADSIIAARERGGGYKTLQDFLERVRDRTLNHKSLEALICCGAMDALGERGVMRANIEHLLTYNRDHERASTSQGSLFSLMKDISSVPQLRLVDAPSAAPDERLRWEKELLGLYVSGHPLDRYRERLERRGTDIRRMKTELREGMLAVAAGLVENTKQVFTKNGEKMLFATIADLSGSIEVVFFPRTLTECREHLEPERCIAIKGRMSNRNGTVSMIAEAVKAL
ncbi:MAG: DNA polymerase III subunit alpha [bacterium]|nr:DNA polymerase III subunit alpha [bacterium]MDZ4284750.1 DNA polymerase III subunit alpha [Patescibacteria group bacterium]